ncbi:hypothetical protein ACLB2K_062805 [Fragaria x ananassa]
MLQKLQVTSTSTHFEGCLESSFDSCFDDKAALAAADMAAAATPTLAPPAAFIAVATFANAAIPPTSIALKATVGFIAIFMLPAVSDDIKLSFGPPSLLNIRFTKRRERAMSQGLKDGSIFPQGSMQQTNLKSICLQSNLSLSLCQSYINGTTSSPIYGPQSFLHVSDAAILAQARDLDEKLCWNEEVGHLAEVLVAVKDNICTAEMSSTTGSRVLEGYTPPYNATYCCEED